MEDDRYRSLESRIEALEKGLLHLERSLGQRVRLDQEEAKRRLSELTHTRSRQSRDPLSSLEVQAKRVFERFRNTEGWIGKIGITLLLLGLVFLFKYAVDQGWLTPGVRLLFGLALGMVLLFFSARLYEKRRHFSLLLFGGGIVDFYVTGFAAFQVFHLVGHGPATAFMVAVTVLSFLVSVRQMEAFPALLATLGGLATPFLLYVDPGSLPGLVAYTCVLMTGALLVYFRCGWRPLLWLTFFGGGLVLATALMTGFVVTDEPNASDRLPMQAGLVYAWLLFAVLPLAREAVVVWPRSNLHPTVPGVRLVDVSDRTKRYLRQHLILLIPVVAILGAVMSSPIYQLEKITWGWVMLGVALVYGAATYFLYDRGTLADFATAHGMTALIFLTVSFALLFEDHERMLVLTFEAMSLLVVANRFRIPSLRIAGHVLFSIILFSMLDRLFATDLRTHVILNPRAIVDLILFSMALYGSSGLPSLKQRNIYRVVVHLALLIWVVRELDSLNHGQGLITITWGVYAVILVVAGLRLDYRLLRTVGMGTLLLVVGKLFFVDLSTVDTIWRILLFLGFGAVFLLLSYFFRSLWRESEP